jgi:F420 biosynthesis protein FbiB-like protein
MSGPEPLIDLIRTRRSIRRYSPQPVSPGVVQRLLYAATFAPSAHNRQPWRFAVIASPESRAALARAMGERLRRDRLADGDPLEAIEADVNRSYARITSAAFVVVVCLTMQDMDRYPDSRRRQAEYLMAVQGAAMAAQNLLLAAHAEGLGACWLCAPLFSPDVVQAALACPPDWEPQGLITLGFADGDPKPRPRKSAEEVTIWR